MAVASTTARPISEPAPTGKSGFSITTQTRWTIASVVMIVLFAIALTYRLWPALPARVANQDIRFPTTPPSASGWAMENAFPNLKFFEPTCVAAAQDGSNRVFVLERRGTIQLLENKHQTSIKRQLVDFSSHVIRTPYEDDGALGMVLHPEFGQPNSPNREYLYLFYTASVDGKCYDRLSRFSVGEGNRINPSSELVLIDQLDDNLWHNGGALAFGPDGFLYIGVGDEGVGDDGVTGDGLSNGQKIKQDLYSGILRIDVDLQGGEVSHPPPRQPTSGTTSNYFIPNDNPFVGEPNALEEFWAIGLRNPHRISFDPETKQLWVGDVGHFLREEINIVSRGSNHGWSYVEGRLPYKESYLAGKKPNPYFGTEAFPIYEYPHLNGNACIIGGHVYRGKKYPELQGKYIYADNGSGRVFMLDYDGQKVLSNTQLTALPVSSKTGISSIDLAPDGELWIVVLGDANKVDGTIHRIVPSKTGSNALLPGRLSQTGLFADLETLTPAPGVVPYGVNVEPWSDGAKKRRWIWLPGDGTDPDPALDRIGFAEKGEWDFPTGTIFVKHFELPIDETDESITKRLETRILVRDATGGVYGVTYKWNDEGTDAELLEDVLQETVTIRTKNSGLRKQIWQYPGRQTCIVCHNQNAGGVLGVNSRQLNRDHHYRRSGKSGNQLAEWNRIGMFTLPHIKQSLIASPRLTPTDDSYASLDDHVQSYLDVNCSACHRPGGVRANFDARFEADSIRTLNMLPSQGDFGLAEAKIIAPGDPFRSVLLYRMATLGRGHMPHLGSLEIDSQGLALFTRWTFNLAERYSSEASPELTSLRRSQVECLERLLKPHADDALARKDIQELLSTSSGALFLAHALRMRDFPGNVAALIVQSGNTSSDAGLQGLFEAFIPPDDRQRRIGTEVDTAKILALRGDASRGRKLVLSGVGLQCKSCHPIYDEGVSIGPDLTHIAKKYDRKQLLECVTDPSKRIDLEYRAYVVQTDSGQVYQGLLTSQTADGVVLKDNQGKQIRIKAQEIDQMDPLPVSLMPEQLLRDLTYQEAADLIEFLSELN